MSRNLLHLALVGLLAAACVGLGATAGWLWFGAPSASPENAAVTKAGLDAPGERSAVPVSNSGRAPAAEEGNAAKFVGRDDKLAGNWKQRFGGDGYVIFNRNGGGQHEVQLPTYLSEVTCTGDGHVWAVNDDARGLEDPNDPKKRYQTCMYSNSDMLLSVKAARPLPYRVSVYCLDGDRLGRKQKVEVLDGDKVLHAQDVEEMGGGVWLTWEFRGSLDIRFTNTGPHNAVLAGIFFDTDEKLKVAKRSPPKGPMPGEDQLKPGVWAEYFDQLPTYPNVKDVATVRRIEPGIAFGGMQPLQPGQGLRGWPFAGACAALFSGYVKIPEDGAYTFFVESDDGARLYIDGELAVDNDGRHPMKEASKRLDLKAGLHRVWVEYFNAEPPMGLNVYMQGKDGKKAPIPEGTLLYDPSEVLSESSHHETAVARR
ncbi:MAG: hypothetical protein KIS92_02945 [Planctomycetota bacterium]|nr:hypothetical protein [Planctomycetota bacterium]